VAEAIAARGGIKGEITLVVAPPGNAVQADDAEVDQALEAALAGMTTAKAASLVARRYGRPRRELYQRALALKGGARADGD
jgi:16S rRNA (cytidine1402-2'-O)-methyltransferase